MSTDLFAGPLRPFARTLIVDDARPLVSVPELLRPATLDRLLMQVYGPELMPDKLPVLVSQFAKYYFMQLIVPVLVASLVHDRTWPLALDQVAFAVSERGLLDGVKFQGEVLPVPPSTDPFQRFAPMLEHVQAVVEVLSAYGSVGSSVLWSSAGDYLETCLRQLAATSDVSLEAGYGLLRERIRTDGRRNPLFNAITYVEQLDGQPARRQRRSCCLSHRVEWVGRCEHCPLHDGHSQV